MRFTRLLLLVAAAAAVAGIAVPSAGALTFPDDICPVARAPGRKVSPRGETGNPHTHQKKGRGAPGCAPYVPSKSTGTVPPGLSISPNGLISGPPTQPGDYFFYTQMQDIPA